MARRLILLSIALTDYGHYGPDTQVFHFGGQGPVAVVGPNGSGKTTGVAGALTWCLYGKGPPQRMGSSSRALAGAAVIREGATQAEVVASFLLDGEPVSVTRTRGKGADKVMVKRTGSADATQEAVDQLIGASYEVFTRTVVRGQGDPWAFAEATDARKLEILDAISGAEKLGVALERAKKLAGQLTAEVKSLTDRAVDAERRASTLDPAAAEAQAAAWDAQRAQRVAEAQREVAALDAAVSEAQRLDGEIAAFRGQRAAVEARRPTLDMGPYDRAQSDAITVYHRSHGALTVVQQRIAQSGKLAVGSQCFACGQVVGPQAPVAVMRAAAEAEVPPLEAADVAAAAAVKAANEAREGAAKWLRDAELTWHRELDAIPTSQGDRVGPAQRARDQAARRVAEIESAVNPYAGTAQTIRQQRDSLQREAAHLTEAASHGREEAGVFLAWEEVLAPKGVRAHLAESALSVIEAEAGRWLDVLSRGRLQIRFSATRDTQKGTTREEIVTIVRAVEDGKPIERDLLTFSGGERARVNFAVDLAVGTVFARGGSLALSLLVLDEAVFSGLDEEGKAAMVIAVSDAGVADVVVVDHDPRLAAVLPRRIRVSRNTQGYSVVEET